MISGYPIALQYLSLIKKYTSANNNAFELTDENYTQ